MGAALVGGVGVGVYADFTLAAAMNPVAETIDPDPHGSGTVAELSVIFKETYRALIPVYDRLAAMKTNQE